VSKKEFSEQDKKDFARKQSQFLRECGIFDPVRIGRIFKIAGPGQIQDAYKLATCEDWELERNKPRKDLLECLLSGFPYVEWGQKRMEVILREAGFPVPKTNNSDCFDRILDGALEILVPGSGELDEQEMQEIMDKIKQRSDKEVNPKKNGK
jgi:hypothetical protein